MQCTYCKDYFSHSSKLALACQELQVTKRSHLILFHLFIKMPIQVYIHFRNLFQELVQVRKMLDSGILSLYKLCIILSVVFHWLRNERSGKRFSHTRLGVMYGFECLQVTCVSGFSCFCCLTCLAHPPCMFFGLF